jgi:hypothetical protein
MRAVLDECGCLDLGLCATSRVRNGLDELKDSWGSGKEFILKAWPVSCRVKLKEQMDSGSPVHSLLGPDRSVYCV